MSTVEQSRSLNVVISSVLQQAWDARWANTWAVTCDWPRGFSDPSPFNVATSEAPVGWSVSANFEAAPPQVVVTYPAEADAGVQYTVFVTGGQPGQVGNGPFSLPASHRLTGHGLGGAATPARTPGTEALTAVGARGRSTSAGQNLPALDPLARLYQELAQHSSGSRALAARVLPRAAVREVFQQALREFTDSERLDCLSRTLVNSPPAPIRARRCIISIVSPGYEHLLDTMLKTLNRFGDCEDVPRVVLCVDGDDKCCSVIQQNNAVPIECTSLGAGGAAMRGALYSVARWVDAEEFLLLDADMLIVGSLQPLFDALQVLAPLAVGMVRARRGSWSPELADPADLQLVMREDFGGSLEDVAFITGQSNIPRFYWFNGGLMLARREALLNLDAALRGLEPFGSLWLDERRDLYWREEGLMDMALALDGQGALLDDAWNLLTFRQGVEVKWQDDQLNLSHNGRPIRVLHFAGRGKPLYGEMCRLLDV